MFFQTHHRPETTKSIHMFAMVPERTRWLLAEDGIGRLLSYLAMRCVRGRGLHTLTGAMDAPTKLGCYRLLRPTRPFS